VTVEMMSRYYHCTVSPKQMPILETKPFEGAGME